jgi:hypothetical protein
MLLEFKISSTQSPLGKQRAGGIDTLDRPRPECHPGSMIGYYEGSWEQVMSLVRGCQEAMRDDPPRDLTLIVFDHVEEHNNGLTHVLKQRIPAIAPQIANFGQNGAINSGRTSAKYPVRRVAVSQLR